MRKSKCLSCPRGVYRLGWEPDILERAHEWGGGQRERVRTSSRFPAGCRPGAPSQDPEIMTLTGSKSWGLNGLSHPGGSGDANNPEWEGGKRSGRGRRN